MTTSQTQKARGPVSDAILVALAGLVDDARGATREPSHSDLDFVFQRTGITAGDPKSQGQTVGKAKRVRAALSWAMEAKPDAAEVFVASLLAMLRGKGGFRSTSPNFCGADAIADAVEAFRAEGVVLSEDGQLTTESLDTLRGVELTAALETYIRRARRGSEDAALLVGTGKDLLEATAAHILNVRFGQYPQQANFPTLLGQAFTALDLATPLTATQPGESPQRRLQRAMYEAGCAVNALRNKQGTGHGRPWLPSVSSVEATSAVQLIGIVAGFLLKAHKEKP